MIAGRFERPAQRGGEAVVSCRFGGGGGRELRFEDREDLVVVRSQRRGARHDLSPLTGTSRAARERLQPLFGFPAAGVGVYEAPGGAAPDISGIIQDDPEVRFAGRGLRDEFGAPVVYTENVFVRFADGIGQQEAEAALRGVGLEVRRALPYAGNAFFAAGEEGVGREIFARAEALLERSDVELCHPELVREVSWNAAFPEQWHLQEAVIDGSAVDAHANVTAAWELSEGEGITIAVIDDGVDIDHEELASEGKIVAPHSLTRPRADDPRPADGDNHGTACSGVACADGAHGAGGVAPRARLMPLRMVSGLGSQDEADAFVWAADHGADVISCSWGPVDGPWWDADDPRHDQVVPLSDSTRLAIDYAVAEGRGGKGCAITWAAGNGNEDVGNDGYASYEKVIAVAACNDQGKKSAYSDYGEAVWCCFPSSNGAPSLTPGVWTTDRSGIEGYNQGDLTLGDEAGHYTNSFGGTSSSCPGVAGVLALVLARNPQLNWQEVRELVRRSCDRIDEADGSYDENGHSPHYGYGRVNAHTAVDGALDSLSE
jgi:subtilisin family serine protease